MFAANKNMPSFHICISSVFFCINHLAKTSSTTKKINGDSGFLYLVPEFCVNTLSISLVQHDDRYNCINELLK